MKILFKTFLAVISAFLMIGITFFSLSKTISIKTSFDFHFLSELLLKELFIKEEKEQNKDFIFINLEYENAIIDKEDKDVLDYIIGNQVIRDREKLIQFLKILQKSPVYKLIFIDVDFDLKTEYDKELAAIIKKTSNVIISKFTDNKGKKRPLSFEVEKNKLANGDVFKYFGESYTHSLFFDDSVKTVTLAMYELKNKKSFKLYSSWLNLYQSEDKLFFNSIIAKPHITNKKLGSVYTLFYLSELIRFIDNSEPLIESNYLKKLLKDRVIVLGSFKSVEKLDLFNKDNRTLFLVNHFLAVDKGENVVSFSLVLFLFVIYFLVSMSVLFSKHYWLSYAYSFRKKHSIRNGFKYFYELGVIMVVFLFISFVMIESFSVFFGLLVFLISSFYFNIYFNLSLLTLYFYVFIYLHYLFVVFDNRSVAADDNKTL